LENEKGFYKLPPTSRNFQENTGMIDCIKKIFNLQHQKRKKLNTDRARRRKKRKKAKIKI
jgi:hypothetical protein